MASYLKTIKSESELFLKSKGLEVNPNLPLIEDLSEVTPRSAHDVAARAFAMSNLTGIGYNANRKKIRTQLKEFDLWSFVTAMEQKDLKAFRVTKEKKIHYQWLCECIQGLAWCLGLVELNHLERCAEDLADKLPPKINPSDIIANATLKPLTEIQRQVDLMYRLNWSARVPERHKDVKGINFNVIAERRRAIDWVYGVEKDWDAIVLNT